MNPSEIPLVSRAFSYIAGIISVLPLFFLLNARAVDRYRAFVHSFAPLERYIAKRNRLNTVARFLPSPGILLGILLGFASVFAVDLAGKLLPEEFSKGLGKQDNLTKVAVIAFVLAGMLEEFWKCSLGLMACLIFTRVWRDKPRDGEKDGTLSGLERDRPLFASATPFILGAVGLGFALLENAAYMEGIPVQSLPGMLFARGMASAVLHTAINFTFGLALLNARPGRLGGVVVGAYGLAVLQHGVFNFFALPQGNFPDFLTGVVLISVVFYALWRMYRVMPELKYRALQPERVSESEPAPPPEEPSPGFVMLLMRDEHARARPELQSPPFEFAEAGLGPDVLEVLARPESPAPAPSIQAKQWEFFQGVVERSLGEGFHLSVWDSSSFAAASPNAYEGLRERGVDLTSMRPVRILEFAPRRGYAVGEREFQADRYIYVSCGLGPVLGRELWISFPFPNPLVRWFFLNLATRRELYLKEFRPVPADSSRLGDPRGWYRAFLPVPMLDPARETLKEHLKRAQVPPPSGSAPRDVFDPARWHLSFGAVPAEILFLSGPDLEFIETYGVSDYFFALKHMDYTWANDFRRPGLSVEMVRRRNG